MTASSYPEEAPGTVPTTVPHEISAAVPGYGDLVESSPDALLVVAEDGTIRMVNTAAERMFGYARGELVGSDHRMLLAEGFRNGLERLFFNLRRGAHPDGDAAAAETDTDTAPVEAYGVRRDGTEFQAEVAGSIFSGTPRTGRRTMTASARPCRC